MPLHCIYIDFWQLVNCIKLPARITNARWSSTNILCCGILRDLGFIYTQFYAFTLLWLMPLLFRPVKVVKYCDEYVGLSVCLSVCPHA